MTETPAPLKILNVRAVTLNGKFVRLEPLSETHVPQLAVAGKNESIWTYMLYGNVSTEGKMQLWVQDMLSRQARGTDLCFAVISQLTGKAIGATRFLEIRPKDRGLEIGGTWYAVEYQRTAVNTECKYLLLRHAFDTLGCIRVQFKTDLRNLPSQKAIERLGAVKEGIFRNHMVLADGTIRDSVYYSIIDSDWPGIKAWFEMKLFEPK